MRWFILSAVLCVAGCALYDQSKEERDYNNRTPKPWQDTNTVGQSMDLPLVEVQANLNPASTPPDTNTYDQTFNLAWQNYPQAIGYLITFITNGSAIGVNILSPTNSATFTLSGTSAYTLESIWPLDLSNHIVFLNEDLTDVGATAAAPPYLTIYCYSAPVDLLTSTDLVHWEVLGYGLTETNWTYRTQNEQKRFFRASEDLHWYRHY